ncbi:MAG: hypothetical protein RIS54_952 [Verrucomicrobiota bacterium]|jgi:protein SCO1/2
MKSVLLFIFAFVLTTIAQAACKCGENCKCGGEEKCSCEKTANAEEPAEAGHPLRGVVTRKLEDRKLVLVKHEEIPGFMRAMTMAFSVPEKDWPSLEPGVHLTATLHGGRGDWRLSGITLTDENYQPRSEDKKK